ncbi:MAG: hypothetical protein JST91_08615 [Actinobacteria bacterium]|nr:hypothetical protein [Actinomycetota bacterium]
MSEIDTTGEAESAPGGEGASDTTQGLVAARDRYRAERDASREELATAQARIATYQRAEIERLASQSLAYPSDLFTLSGNDVTDYTDDAGAIDPAKVAADVAAILAERPGLTKLSPVIDPTQGHGSRTPAPAQPTWGSLLDQGSLSVRVGGR